MLVLIYFIASFAAGLLPAMIARNKKKNFILWWIYSTFFFPIALLHSFLLLLNSEKGLFVIRILLVLYGLVAFYFVSWFISTQPTTLKWLTIGQHKYTLGTFLYTHMDEVVALQTTIVDYVTTRTGEDVEIIKGLFSTLETEKQNEKAYLEEFAQSRLKEINSQYQNFMLTEEEAAQRNKIVEAFISMINEISATKFMTIQQYLSRNTHIDLKEVEDIFAYFEDNLHADRDYLGKFAITLIKEVSAAYTETTRKGAFDDWSVPLGEAEKVIRLYLTSLKDLNSYMPDDQLALESNYKSYLKAESTYFRTTSIAGEYIACLDKAVTGDIDNDRRQELVDQYVFIGDRYVQVWQPKLAYPCYDRAIALYREIIQKGEKSSKLKGEHLFLIGELYDKNGDLESVMKVYREFISVFFNEGLYLDEDAHYDLEGFLKLSVIANNKQAFVNAVREFTDFADKFETPEKASVYMIENKIISTFFPKMLKEDRIPYAPIIKRNFDFRIASKTLEIFPVIKQAYEFFDKYDFDDLARSYIDYIDSVIPVVDAEVDRITNKTSVAFLAETGKLQEFAEQIVIGKIQPDKRNLDEILNAQAIIRDESKDMIDTIVRIKEALAIIRDLMQEMNRNSDAKKALENDINDKTLMINRVLSDVSRATKEYNDVVNDIIKEDEILAGSYEKVARLAEEARAFSKEIETSPPFKRGENKEKLRTMTHEIRNEVNSLDAIITAIVESKNTISSKYNVRLSSEKLIDLKAKLISIRDEIDALFKKFYPDEEEEEKRETTRQDKNEGEEKAGEQGGADEPPPEENIDNGL